MIGLCALLLALLPIAVVAITATILYGPLSNFCATARSLFSQEVTTRRWRAMTSAILNISMAIGFGGAALIGGRIIAFSGYPGLFLLSAAMALAGFLLYVWYDKTRVKAPPRVQIETPAV